jgi:hypothetical protein
MVMAYLSNPRVLVLADGEVYAVRVLRWEVGEVDIRPARTTALLRVRALRLYVSAGDPHAPEGYVDITGARLIETLLPWLDRAGTAPASFEIRAAGAGPTKVFTVRPQPSV